MEDFLEKLEICVIFECILHPFNNFVLNKKP